jgi:CRP-like cAMP-binding protein
MWQVHLHRVVFIDQDYIVRRGEFSHGMYFIGSGAVDVLLPGSSTPVSTLGHGAFFGMRHRMAHTQCHAHSLPHCAAFVQCILMSSEHSSH